MRLTTISIFVAAGSLVAPTTAKPIPKAGGMAIPLVRHASSPNNESIDLDAITSHAMSVREKILTGLDNYETNTGTMHPFSVKRSGPRLGTRGASLPLKSYENIVWMGEITLGTPPEPLNLHIDTGAADMWVLQEGCTGTSGDNDLWVPNISKTAKTEGHTSTLKFSDGTSVEGVIYTDNVTIAGFNADPQTFLSVKRYNNFGLLRSNGKTEGLLGLAFPSISKLGADPLLTSLSKQNRLTNPTFSLKLSPSGAEMYVGGANSMLYKGDVTYTRVTNPGFWQVSMDDVRINGEAVLNDVPAIINTGASYIIGDWDRVAELYKRFGGTLVQHGDIGYYYLPCDSLPTVGLTFGGRTFDIPPEVLRLQPVAEGSPDCFAAIIAAPFSTGFWSIGLTFLQGVYTVFDYSTQQIGFADLA